jgi:hypothetical protein
MSDILAQVGTKVGSEIKNLDIRLSSAENAIVNLGGQQPPPTGDFTIEAVNWTNLSEINLSGEKLLNTDFSSVSSQYVADSANDGSNGGTGLNPVKLIVLTSIDLKGTIFSAGSILHGVGFGGTNNSLIRMEDPNDPRDYPYTTTNQNTGTWDWENISDRGVTWEYAKLESFPTNWSVLNGTLDQTQLANGIIQGDGGSVAIQQTFAQTIPTGTELVFKATRADNETGNIRFNPIRASDGVAMSANIGIDPSVGYATYTTTIAITGVKLDTLHGLREINSVSIFQGVVSGGSVQTFTGGSIEKISGSDGYNAGASSVQKIDGQSNGYVQFQIGTPSKSVRVGLVGIDSDFEVDPPFQMNFGGGTIDLYSPWLSNYETYESGDWFRIRHYSANNEIKFQKREDVYGANASLRTSNYSIQDDNDIGDYVIFLKTDVGQQISGTDVAVTLNRGYEIVGYSSASNQLKVLDDNGNNAWLALDNPNSYRNRGDAWEFAENIGQDYFTFYTHPTFSNGNDLYLDTSFHTIGSRINDVQIAYK